jgi:lipopolysaccharide export system permease protein
MDPAGPVVRVPTALVIAVLSLTLTPWAVSMSEEMRRQLEGRDDIAVIAPGVFRESRMADRVFFVEEVPGQQDVVANVFVSSSQLEKQGVMVAARGFPGDRRKRRPLPRC